MYVTVHPFFILSCINIEYHEKFKMICHFSVKMPICPQKGAKVGRAVGENQLFVILLKIGSLDFLIFCIQLEGLKGYKLLQMPFFGNILIFTKKEKKCLKMGK